MDQSSLKALIEEHSIEANNADAWERLRAVASAPESLVDGPDVGLVLPGATGDQLAAVSEAVANAIRAQTIAYKADIGTENGKARVALLRDLLAKEGVRGCVVPMADEFQNEYVPIPAQRLAWLSGFSGSAGTIVVLDDTAAIFVDGRYTLQVGDQVDTEVFETLGHDKVGEWLKDNLQAGDVLAYDPWLHTGNGVGALRNACESVEAMLVSFATNPVDAVWEGQPPAPLSRFVPQSEIFAGEDAASKRQRIGAAIAEEGAQLAVLTSPDSIAWLLNIRGADVAHTPLPLSYALLGMNGAVELFCDQRKGDDALIDHLGSDVRLSSMEDLDARLMQLGAEGASVMIDPARCPSAIADMLSGAGAATIEKADPCQAAKAIKNDVEMDGMRAAHIRDGLAMVRFMAWLDRQDPTTVDEFAVADQLRALRAEGDYFRDLSFPTIAGSGPNGAIVHYGATDETNRHLRDGEFLLVDSGAQYLDGTTDARRTYPIGKISDEQIDRFTRVMRCHIALASAVFPKGTTGHQLDVLARAPLWEAGLNFAHGTGHGVGAYLGVHEGPHNISPRAGSVPLEAGVVISNEPGFYKAGEYGIRCENLILVVPAHVGDDGEYYTFEALTLAPFDRRAINPDMMTQSELDWLNAYHQRVYEAHEDALNDDDLAWLAAATVPLGVSV